MDTEPITATSHTTHHGNDAWTIDLYTHGPAGYEHFAVVGTSDDEGDADDEESWIIDWAERVGYTILSVNGSTVELRPAPPARWTVEVKDDDWDYRLDGTDQHTGAPTSAYEIAAETMWGRPDGLYRVITWSDTWLEMDRVEVEVCDEGRSVERADLG